MARISDSQILDAALAVIAQQGYAGATTRQIADAAGINEVTLFRRFGSKQNLLKAVVEQEAENFSTSGIVYSGDIEADLIRIVTFYHKLVLHRGHVISMLLSEIPRQPELLEVMQTPLAIVEKIQLIIERYQAEGMLIKEEPIQAFIGLVGPLFMYGVARFIIPALDETNQSPEQCVQRYLQGHGCTSSAQGAA